MFKSICQSLYAKRYLIALMLVLAFHLVGNFVWIKLNQSPPSWDEANHIRRSVQYTQTIQSIISGKPNFSPSIDSYHDGYGPLVRIITGIGMLFVGVGVWQSQIISTLFFLATIGAVYLLAQEIELTQHQAPSDKHLHIALGTAVVFSFYQLIYAHSRWLLLDIPVTLFTTLTSYFILKSNWGTVRKYMVYASLCAGCAMLTKAQAIAYFVIPALYLLYINIRRKSITDSLICTLFMVFHLSLLLFALWAIPNFPRMYEYVKAGATIKLDHPYDLRSLTTWTFYAKITINNILTLGGFVLLIPASIAYFKNKTSHRLYIGLMIAGYYVFFTLISNKDLRFIYPILPFVAYVFVSGWQILLRRIQERRNSILMGTVLGALGLFFVFEIVMYTTLSFGWPLPKTISSFVTIPGVQDITILNTQSNYPVKSYSRTTWPTRVIAQDIASYSSTLSSSEELFFLPDYEYLNDNNVGLELTLLKAKHVILRRGIEKPYFDNQSEVRRYLNQFKNFFYVEGSFSPDFLWNKKLFEQIQKEIHIRYVRGELRTVKRYQLPNGKVILWFSVIK